MTHLLSPDQLRKELATFTGSERFFLSSVNPSVIYSEGVRHLVEAADAQWLVDVIAEIYASEEMARALRVNRRLNHMQLWTLDVIDSFSSLTMRADLDQPVALSEMILIAEDEFPLETIDILAGYSAGFWTLYLPSEH